MPFKHFLKKHLLLLMVHITILKISPKILLHLIIRRALLKITICQLKYTLSNDKPWPAITFEGFLGEKYPIFTFDRLKE